MENIEQKIINMLSEQLCISESKINLSSRLEEDLGADSLDIVELVMTVEDYYNIDIEDYENVISKIKTVKDIIMALNKYVNNNEEAIVTKPEQKHQENNQTGEVDEKTKASKSIAIQEEIKVGNISQSMLVKHQKKCKPKNDNNNDEQISIFKL